MAKAVLAVVVLLSAVAVYHLYGNNGLDSTWKDLSNAVEIHLIPQLQGIHSWVSKYLSEDSKPAKSSGTEKRNEKLYTKEELKKLKFTHLSIVGEVYDVSSGEKHYGKDGHYNFFTGLDGSRAYTTGEFNEEGLKEDLSGLKPSDLQAIESFRSMYAKQYSYAGKLIGHFYTADGEETENKRSYRNMLDEAKRNKAAEEEFQKLYPPCNSEFTGKVSRVWCSNRSGGINREWAGVPRRMYKPGSDSFRCACIKTTGPPSTDPKAQAHSNRGDLDNPNLREYEGCDSKSKSCNLKPGK